MPEQVSEETKGRVVREAADAVETTPVRALSMQDIAERAGVSKSAIYKAYGSKHELFADACAVVLAEQIHDIASDVDESSPPLEIIRTVLAGMFAIGREYPYAAGYLTGMLPLVQHAGVDEIVLERTEAVQQDARHRLRHRLAAAVDSGDLAGDLDKMTEFCVITMFGYVGESMADREMIDPDEFADMVIASLQSLRK